MSETVTIETPQEVLGTGPLPPYLLAEQQLADLETAQESLYREAIALRDALGPEETERFDQADKNYDKIYEDANEKGQEPPAYIDFLEQEMGSEQPAIIKLRAAEAYDSAIGRAEAMLEAHAAEKADAVWKQAKVLEAAADYKAIAAKFEVNGYAYGKELQQLSFVSGVRRLLNADAPVTYHQLLSMQRELEYIDRSWEEDGLKVTVEDSKQNPYTELLNQEPYDISASLTVVEDTITKALDIRKKFGSNIHKTARLQWQTQGIMQDLRSIQTLSSTKEVSADSLFLSRERTINAPLQHALLQAINSRLTALPPEDFEGDPTSDAYTAIANSARNIDSAEALAAVEISGDLSELPVEITEEEIRSFIAETVPPIAIERVKKIAFREMTDKENPDGKKMGHNSLNMQTNTSEIVINSKVIHELFNSYVTSNKVESGDVAADMAKDDIKEVLLHEFGHSLHDTLPYAALRIWDMAASSDTTNVTGYVKNMHDEDHGHRHMEDFADSLALFGTRSHVLGVVSNPRLIALQAIYMDFMPGYKEGLFTKQVKQIAALQAIINSGLISEQEYRHRHTKHETK